jgi:hypothetical protein
MLHDALPRLSEMARTIALDLRGSTGSLGCVCGANRKFIFNRAIRPNSPEHPRGRKGSSAVACCASMRAILKRRSRTIERVFACADKFRRLLLRFDWISQVHYAVRMFGYTLINLRHRGRN